jgi:hypothetical protein
MLPSDGKSVAVFFLILIGHRSSLKMVPRLFFCKERLVSQKNDKLGSDGLVGV